MELVSLTKPVACRLVPFIPRRPRRFPNQRYSVPQHHCPPRNRTSPQRPKNPTRLSLNHSTSHCLPKLKRNFLQRYPLPSSLLLGHLLRNGLLLSTRIKILTRGSNQRMGQAQPRRWQSRGGGPILRLLPPYLRPCLRQRHLRVSPRARKRRSWHSVLRLIRRSLLG